MSKDYENNAVLAIDNCIEVIDELCRDANMLRQACEKMKADVNELKDNVGSE